MYRNIAPAKVTILTTEKNIKMNLSGELSYDKYPLIEQGKDPKWVDSVRPHNSYLNGWGGEMYIINIHFVKSSLPLSSNRYRITM